MEKTRKNQFFNVTACLLLPFGHYYTKVCKLPALSPLYHLSLLPVCSLCHIQPRKPGTETGNLLQSAFKKLPSDSRLLPDNNTQRYKPTGQPAASCKRICEAPAATASSR